MEKKSDKKDSKTKDSKKDDKLLKKSEPRKQLEDYEDPDSHLREKNPKMKPPVGLNYQEFL